MKVLRLLPAIPMLMLGLLASPGLVEAVTLPDNSSCSTTSSNGCFRISNTNTGSGTRAIVGSSSGGHGVYGTTTADSTTAAAVYGYTSTQGAFGVIGHQAGNDSGTGVLGKVTDSSGNLVSNGFAVRGWGGGISIYGQNDVGGTGVVGDSASNIGVLGISNASSGSRAGVMGTIITSADDTCAAVYGDAGNSWSVWAGKFIGDVEARGFYNSSDARLKRDIKNAEYGLSELMKLRPVSYKWKEDSDGSEHGGLIAQEVQKVFPNAVRVGGLAGTLSVNYVSLIPVAIKAIQQQEEVIRRQEARIAALERKNMPMVSSNMSGGLGVAAALALLPVGLVVARRRQARKK